MGDLDVRAYASTDLAGCRAVFADLTDWFGLPDAVEAYLAALPELTTWVACEDNDVVGVLSLKTHSAHAAEIHLLAVARAWHRRGVGRELVRAAEDDCRSREIGYLQVKTLDPARENAHYADTRRFYESLGFVHLETFPLLWGEANPARQLVKRVPPESAASIIARLGLRPHPEGGHFVETWRSDRELALADYAGPRAAGTAIHYLLQSHEVSAWHRVKSDELWLWQAGDGLTLQLSRGPSAPTAEGGDVDQSESVRLAPGASLQALVPGGVWQSAAPLGAESGYVLVSCVVVPGFDYADFELAELAVRAGDSD